MLIVEIKKLIDLIIDGNPSKWGSGKTKEYNQKTGRRPR